MSDAVEKNLDVKITAKDEASSVFARAFENIKRQAKEMNQEARQSGDTALERMLKGGGALGIVTLLGEGLRKVTTEAVKLSDEFEKGKINAADIALEIGKSIPVLGGFVEAGENINELFTHQKEQIEHVNESIKAGNDYMALRVKQQKESIEAEEKLADRARKAAEALRLARAGPKDKPFVESGNKLDDINAKLAEDKKKQEEDRRAALAEQLKGIRDQQESARKTGRDEVDNAGVGALYYNTHTDSEREELIEERKRNSDFHVDSVFDKNIRDAEAKAKQDIADNNKKLDEIAANDRTAVKDDLHQKAIDDAKKRVHDIAEATRSALEEAAHRTKEVLSPKQDQLAQETADAIAKSKEDQLRISGKALEADLLQLKNAHEKRLAEIKREAQEEVAAHPTEVRRIRRDEVAANSAENDSYQSQIAQANEDAKRDQAIKHAEIQKTLGDTRLQLLEKEAALGDAAAAKEAEKLRIAGEYNRLKAELLKLSQGASEQDRAALAAQAEQLDRQQHVATVLAELKPQIDEAMKPARNAGFEDFRKTQGIADAQRERDRANSQTQVQHLLGILESAKSMDAKFDALIQHIQNGDGVESWDSNLN